MVASQYDRKKYLVVFSLFNFFIVPFYLIVCTFCILYYLLLFILDILLFIYFIFLHFHVYLSILANYVEA